MRIDIKRYIALLRGINISGKNKISMAELKAGKTCSGCGTCANACPMGAIPKHNPKKTDNDKGITCMGRVAICPKHARKLNPIVLKVASHKMKKTCGTRKENEFIMNTHS